MTELNMASYIDHTLLKSHVTKEEIVQLCQEAKKSRFASVCVNPYWIKECAQQLKDTSVKVCTVIGFPLGANTPEVKGFETKQAIDNGATEVDMVINIGALKSGDDDLVQKDISSVVEAAKGRALVKVIIETSLLTDDEKVKACQFSQAAGADFVKTSTGFSTGGATLEDVQLMRETVGPEMGIKASGGVRDYHTALAMIHQGATRIGTSNGLAIVNRDPSNPTAGY